MSYVLGVDPGKDGAFVLLDSSGAIVSTWMMVYNGSTLSAPATAEVYREIITITGKDVHVFIEKAFTMPTDAMNIAQVKGIKELVEAGQILTESYERHQSGESVMKSIFDDQFQRLGACVAFCSWVGGFKYRPDGRVGNFNYAKSCGVLEMCAAFALSYTLVHPKTWCPVMHKGADANLKAKDRSKQIIERRWPELGKKGSALWKEKGRKMHEGLMDAFLIAQYGLQA